MLLGGGDALIVPLRYKFKPTSPRDADTANTLFLEVCSLPAVCELPFSLCEREFVPSDCGNKNKHHPRGMVFVFMAQEEGFEPPCLLGKRFSRPPRCDRFDIPAYHNARCRIMISRESSAKPKYSYHNAKLCYYSSIKFC